MEDFLLFLKEGLNHITDLNGYDHILFVVALTAAYQVRQWKRIALLVTFFTLGHSISLALATTGLVKVDTAWVEFLIPVTIIFTCINNIWSVFQPEKSKYALGLRYSSIVFFGLIHGLGFSNYIRQMLMESESIFLPLLSFNIGLELGQLLIVAIAFALNYGIKKTGLNTNWWTIGISAIIALLSLQLAWERI